MKKLKTTLILLIILFYACKKEDNSKPSIRFKGNLAYRFAIVKDSTQSPYSLEAYIYGQRGKEAAYGNVNKDYIYLSAGKYIIVAQPLIYDQTDYGHCIVYTVYLKIGQNLKLLLK